MLSLLLSGNQAIDAFASIVNPHRAPLIAPNSPPYCGVRGRQPLNRIGCVGSTRKR